MMKKYKFFSGNNRPEAAKLWLEKAEHDAGSAFLILREADFFDNVCFLAHQSAEKSLKGLLVFNSVEPDRIHNLEKLRLEVEKFAPEINDFENELKKLNEYYIPTRYPSDAPTDYTKQEAKEAVENAEEIIKFVKSKI